MRKPPIFLDKPIAGAIIRQTDRIALSVFAAQIFSPGRGASVEGFHGRAAPFFVCAGKGGTAMLTRYRRVNVEGARLLLGQWWDVRTRSWLPLYPDLIAHPRHTPAGRRVLLCLEDACAHAALDDSGYRDCGSCRHYWLQPRGLLGTCGHPSQGAPPAPAAPQCRLPRHPCQPGKDAAARSTTTTKEETP